MIKLPTAPYGDLDSSKLTFMNPPSGFTQATHQSKSLLTAKG